MNAAPAAVAPCTKCAVHTESVFRVSGMCCAEEAAILERRLRPIAGVDALSADILGQKLHVSYDGAVLTASRIVDAVAETGMHAWLEHDGPAKPPESRLDTARLALAGAAIGVGFAVQLAGGGARWSWPAFALAIALAGVAPARKAWLSLKRRSLDIQVLMVVAVAGAIAIGEWAEGATVVWLFAVSQWLEVRTMERARHAIREVLALAPAEARVKSGAHEHVVPVDRVAIGATIVVRPGEKIPLDGLVVAGRSDVNQAPITGESLPVERGPGDEIYAGTINGRGALDVRVTRAVRDTTLARIVHLVESAQAQRAPAQLFIDRFARWYTPAVVAVAAAVFVVPVAILGQPAAAWAYRALGAAGRGVPVRAGHLHAGVDCRCARHRRQARGAGQGRRAPRAAGVSAHRGVRQDRYAHPRRADRRGGHRAPAGYRRRRVAGRRRRRIAIRAPGRPGRRGRGCPPWTRRRRRR